MLPSNWLKGPGEFAANSPRDCRCCRTSLLPSRHLSDCFHNTHFTFKIRLFVLKTQMMLLLWCFCFNVVLRLFFSFFLELFYFSEPGYTLLLPDQVPSSCCAHTHPGGVKAADVVCTRVCQTMRGSSSDY